jgi:hypothetical protein
MEIKMETELSKIPQDKFYETRTRYVLGGDIGQSQDPTALCVIEGCVGVIDPGSDYDRHTGLSKALQTPGKRFRVVHLERMPLQTSYPDIIRHVAALLARDPLQKNEDRKQADLVIDQTGVGAPVGDMFVEAGMKPVRITITGGLETTSTGPNRWNVPKHVLIANLDAMLAHDKWPLQFSNELRDSVVEEIANFVKATGAAGRNTYNAREGKHDDLIMATALAAWWISRPPPATAGWGTYSRTVPPQASYGRKD